MANFFGSRYSCHMEKTRDKHPEDWYQFSKHVVAALAAAAKDKGKTRKELAAVMGVSYVAFSGWINGKRGMPTVGAIYAGCNLIGVEPADVVGEGYRAFLRARTAADVSSLDAQRAKKRIADAESGADDLAKDEDATLAAAQTPPPDSDER